MTPSPSIADFLNKASPEAAHASLTSCCAAGGWVEGMLGRRPFADDDAVTSAARAAWDLLSRDERRKAYAAHPMIGDLQSLQEKYAGPRDVAAGEQAGAAGASEATLRELAALNKAYRDRFGFIFIVFATGKTADEMLALLKSRIQNSPAEEETAAAQEQLKITLLRLQTLAARRPGA